MRSFVELGGAGIVVGAKLRTRQADADVPFCAAFGSAGETAGAVAGVVEAGLPLWHLAFLNPGMARARNLRATFLLFGAYPAGQEGEIEGDLRSVVASSGGLVLSAAEAYRAWGERFFPVTRSVLPRGFPSCRASWSRWSNSRNSWVWRRTVPGTPSSRAPSPALEMCCS